MIYTSYFARSSKVPNPVSIAGKAPGFYKGPEFKELAPRYDFFMDYKNGVIDSNGYTEQYIARVLSKFTPDDLRKQLYLRAGVSESSDITLLCYEKVGDFCHRHLVAEFLQSGGIETKEWSI